MDIRSIKTKEDVQSVLDNAGNKVVLVKFMAEWCGPCRLYQENIEKLPEDVWNDLIVLNANVEDAEDLSVEFGVRSIPASFFFLNKNQVDSFTGLLTTQGIIDKINNVLLKC